MDLLFIVSYRSGLVLDPGLPISVFPQCSHDWWSVSAFVDTFLGCQLADISAA